MITEDYVSYEIAKLLKEKGFNEKVDTFYKMDAEFLKSTLCINYNDVKFALLDMHNIPENTVSAPTLQMAMKWLREIHNIDISVTPDRKAGYSVLIFKAKRLPFYTLDSYSIYEEACEAAIKYCLENMI